MARLIERPDECCELLHALPVQQALEFGIVSESFNPRLAEYGVRRVTLTSSEAGTLFLPQTGLAWHDGRSYGGMLARVQFSYAVLCYVRQNEPKPGSPFFVSKRPTTLGFTVTRSTEPPIDSSLGREQPLVQAAPAVIRAPRVDQPPIQAAPAVTRAPRIAIDKRATPVI